MEAFWDAQLSLIQALQRNAWLELPMRAVSLLGEETFFLLLVVSFVDVLGGFAITLRSAQRDLTVEGVEHVTSS